ITTSVFPNNDYGWGRVDALAAVLVVAHSGLITGVVMRSDNAAPIVLANIHAQSIANNSIDVATNAVGAYTLNAAPGSYTLTVMAFGYLSQTQPNVSVITNTSTHHDFSLAPLPIGVVQGRLIDVTGTKLLSGSIAVLNTPVTIAVSGTYSIGLPGGTYTLRVQSPLHRILSATIVITANRIITQDFVLADAPGILLVDSGAWYNSSEISYYQQALADNNYAYTLWPIADPASDVPTTATLRQYQAVIWSSPLDSPGYVGADLALDDYLRRGGHLFLSGQDVGFWDGYWLYTGYYYQRLLARLVADDGPTRQLKGQQIFAGQQVTITGAGGADNQTYPDVIASLDPLLAQSVFDYVPGQSGGQSVGLCQPHRSVYLSYGFEAINDRAARDGIISNTFKYFESPRQRYQYVLDQANEPLIAAPGHVVTGSIDLHNLDELTPATTFSISVSSAWNASITPTVMMLNSCAQRSITVAVTVPLSSPIDAQQMITISAHPIVSPTLIISSAVLVKAPASVLLVDDDCWYPVDQPYRDGLSANKISYDRWRVPTSWVGDESAVPSLERLNWYPAVMWFTGYDWYQTLTDYDEDTLAHYLSGGGRLLLSSQGYLDEHGLSAFGRKMLGILDFTDTLTTTVAVGPHGSVFDGLNFGTLNFPYPNLTVAIAPEPGAQVALLGSYSWPVALVNRSGLGKSLFMAFGFEDLPAALQPEAMNRAIGYLSWLGGSQVKFDQTSASAGDVVTATIAVLNDMPLTVTHAAYSITLPFSTTLERGDPLIWSGKLRPNQSITSTVVIKLDPGLTAGDIVTLPVRVSDQDHAIQFVTAARLTINSPAFAFDLRPNRASIRPGGVVAWTLVARNHGVDAPAAQITALLPFNQLIVSGSLTYNAGFASVMSDTVLWHGAISTGHSLTLTYQMRALSVLSDHVYYGGAAVSAGADVWQTGNWLTVAPYKTYLPLMRK
ncbi:MAG TPA: carboxypeptidase-like regulatory domain-containing protein, partial [Anaerolineae bacterium]|nr:carboxypeptidase-like regulatory domain-containing protein [Anaerolineae bacterium]